MYLMIVGQLEEMSGRGRAFSPFFSSKVRAAPAMKDVAPATGKTSLNESPGPRFNIPDSVMFVKLTIERRCRYCYLIVKRPKT